MTFEVRRDDYFISTDKSLLDRDMIHIFLSQRSYWAKGRERKKVERAIEHSLCFGVYNENSQVGFARVVSDLTTFAWLCDVFILEEERGKGLGKWLVESILTHPELQGLKTFMLATRDAHGLYRSYGDFEPLSEPEKWMARRVA